MKKTDFRVKLKEIYPDCWLCYISHKIGYCVYSTYKSDRIILGYGNTGKNAYANSFNNVIKNENNEN